MRICIQTVLRTSIKSALMLLVISALVACNGSVDEPEEVCNSAPLSFESGTSTCIAVVWRPTGTSNTELASYGISQGHFSALADAFASSNYTNMLALHPSGKFLYTVPASQTDWLQALSLDPTSGLLKDNLNQMLRNNGVNFSYGRLLMHPSGELLYAQNVAPGSGEISVFHIDNDPSSRHYGEISGGGDADKFSPGGGVRFGNNTMTMDRSGNFLYTVGGLSTTYKSVYVTVVDLANSNTSKLINKGIVNTAADPYAAVETSGSGLSHTVLAVTDTGELQTYRFSGSKDTPAYQLYSSNVGLSNPSVIRVARDRFVYVGDDNGIHGFDMNAKIGNALQEVKAAASIGVISALYVDPGGSFLYASGAGNVFQIDPDNGDLSYLSASGFPGIGDDMLILKRRF